MAEMPDKIKIPEISECSNFIPVPLCYQETEYTCGTTCVQSLLLRYGIVYSQSTLAEILDSKPILGTDPKSIIFFMHILGLRAEFIENMKIDDIESYIDIGIPPMLMIQAWKEDDIEYNFDWKNNHYIIACGYYEDGIYAMDPYNMGNYTYLPYSDLKRRWHVPDRSGNHLHNCGLIIQYENCPIKYDPKAIKYLK
jgi:ABC-type bacteriocin/lantibiotic exporters, contain an N-terminal double-glycine peptidase domain